MRITLLGAGHIGQTIAGLLGGCGDYAVTVLDRSAQALAPLAQLPVKTQQLSGDDLDTLAPFLNGQQAVINALPYHLAQPAARVAAASGCHYFDLTEDVSATRAIQGLALGARTAFMPQCGLAPGFISVVAHHLAQGFESVQELKMRVGALPAFPTNRLKYNLTWSVDGLINEYCHPCDAIRGGKNIEVLPLEGLEHFSLDGTEYEAFNTSGGLGTLCETWAGRVQTLDYKSVRYPGHCELMKLLLEDLQLNQQPNVLKDIMRASIPSTMQDVVLVFVTASGLRGGQLVQEVFTRKIFADRRADVPLSAIQITTAAGVCAAVDLFAQGRLPQQGFIRQEQMALPDFLANRFGQAYQQNRLLNSIG